MRQNINSVILIERICKIEQRKQACSVFRKILNIQSTCDQFCEDLIENKNFFIKTIKPTGTSYKITDIEELETELLLQKVETTCFWIQSAELLTSVVANRLLKKLEAPPENVNFILTTNNVSLLLPTILSRCTQQFLQIENQCAKKNYADFVSLDIQALFLFFTKKFDLKDKQEFEDLIKNKNFDETDLKELLNALLKEYLNKGQKDVFWFNKGKTIQNLFELTHQTSTHHFIKLLFLELIN